MTLQAQAASSNSQLPMAANFLDQLLEEGQATLAVTQSEPMGLDDFLSDLIGESVKDKADKDRLKEARKLVKNTTLPGSTIHTLRSEIRELEYKAEWKAIADVIWIKRCICEQCGGETPQFAGYFRKAHSRISKAYRYTALSAEVESNLPREMKTEITSVAMCADCIPQILMEDGWLTAEIPEEDFSESSNEQEYMETEAAVEGTEEYQGQEGNLIETEEDQEPAYRTA